VSNVPPITHSGFTEAERQRLLKKEKEMAAAEVDPDIDQELQKLLKSKRPDRGYRAMSKYSKELTARFERELLEGAPECADDLVLA
jgi:hypothetical protein